MSKCDERFARQYRYEPPPGFPLASPYSDIVHHLSGPNTYAHTQTFLEIKVGRWCKNPNCYFHCAHECLFSCTRACVWTPWSVFQDGSFETFWYRCRGSRVPYSATNSEINACAVKLSQRHYARICGDPENQNSHQT